MRASFWYLGQVSEQRMECGPKNRSNEVYLIEPILSFVSWMLSRFSSGVLGVLSLCAVLAVAGCSSQSNQFTHEPSAQDDTKIKVQVNSHIPLVVNITWNNDEKLRGRVTFWSDTEEERSTPLSEFAKKGQLDMLGLLPTTEYHYLIELEDEDGVGEEHVGTVTTGALSPYLPLLNVEELAPSTGYTLVPLVTGEGTGEPSLVILNPEGQIVWYVILPTLAAPTAAVFAEDLKHAYLQVGRTILQIPLNGEDQTVLQTPDGHHDLVETDPNTVAYLKYEFLEHNGATIQSDSIVEILPSGEIREVWNFFDHLDDFSLTESDFDIYDSFTDLTHGNSLQYSKEDDSFVVNFTGNVKGVAKVSRSTGETVWGVSQNTGWTYDLDAAEEFSITHDIAIINDQEFLFFVNITEQSECARIAHVQLDDQSSLATSDWVHGEDDCLTVFGLGGLQLQENDNTQVVWSTAGRMEEYDSSGQLVKRIESTFGYGFGYAHHMESLYAVD